MDKIKTKIKMILKKIIKKLSFSKVKYSKRMQLLNLLNTKQFISVNCREHLVLESFKKHLGINLHAFLISILYFNSAFLINLKIEKA